MKINDIIRETSTVKSVAGDKVTLDVDGKTVDTTRDALIPGAIRGTVSLKPDAAGDQLKPGMTVATDETTSEEIEEEQLDELGKDTLKSYIKKRMAADQDRVSTDSFKSGKAGHLYNKAPWDTDRDKKSEKGVDRAMDRLAKEDVTDLANIKKLAGL